MGRDYEPKPPKMQPTEVNRPRFADTVMRSPTVDQSAGDPMRRERVLDSGPTGDPYIDHGAICDGKDGDHCFLSAEQRGRLIQSFQLRVMAASENFKHAVAQLRVEELLTKDEDLPWFVVLMLDLVTAHLASRLTASLLALRQGSLDGVVQQAGSLDRVTGWRARGTEALGAITSEHLKQSVKQALDGTKHAASALLKRDVNRPSSSGKVEQRSYLERLSTEADLGFAAIRERVPATANDAEIVTLYQSFALEQHLVPLYKEALEAKIARFRDSGINSIGWLPPSAGEDPFWPAVDEDGRSLRVDNGVFVVWHTYASGRPKRLVYKWDGQPGFIPGQGRLGGENLPDGTPHRDDRDLRGKYFVPEEFVEIAIERHRVVWREEPGLQRIDDRWFSLPAPRPGDVGTSGAKE